MGGKNTQVLFLKEVFKKIYYALNTFSSGSKLNYLAEIIKLWLLLLLFFLTLNVFDYNIKIMNQAGVEAIQYMSLLMSH